MCEQGVLKGAVVGARQRGRDVERAVVLWGGHGVIEDGTVDEHLDQPDQANKRTRDHQLDDDYPHLPLLQRQVLAKLPPRPRARHRVRQQQGGEEGQPHARGGLYVWVCARTSARNWPQALARGRAAIVPATWLLTWRTVQRESGGSGLGEPPKAVVVVAAGTITTLRRRRGGGAARTVGTMAACLGAA
jgi:hypothetical protein